MTADPKTEEFLRLLSTCERRLMAMILAMVPDWSAAEDIAQEARIRLWNEFDQYDPSKDFGAWARTIAYYEVLSYRKKAKRQMPNLSDDVLEQIETTALKHSDEKADRLSAMRTCLQKLSQDCLELIERHYRGEESLKDIATQTGRTYQGTRQKVLRTRRALGKCIEQTLRRGGGS